MSDVPKLSTEVRMAIMAQRFLLPFSFVNRFPTEFELAAFFKKVQAEGVTQEDMQLLAETIRDIGAEAAAASRASNKA